MANLRLLGNHQQGLAPIPTAQPRAALSAEPGQGLGVVLKVSLAGKGNRPEWAFVFSLSGACWVLSRKLCTSPEVKIFPVIREFPAA